MGALKRSGCIAAAKAMNSTIYIANSLKIIFIMIYILTAFYLIFLTLYYLTAIYATL